MWRCYCNPLFCVLILVPRLEFQLCFAALLDLFDVISTTTLSEHYIRVAWARVRTHCTYQSSRGQYSSRVGWVDVSLCYVEVQRAIVLHPLCRGRRVQVELLKEVWRHLDDVLMRVAAPNLKKSLEQGRQSNLGRYIERAIATQNANAGSPSRSANFLVGPRSDRDFKARLARCYKGDWFGAHLISIYQSRWDAVPRAGVR